jgi:CRP-like cAMP-binding protein
MENEMIDFFRQSGILTAEELVTLSTHFRSETFKRKAIIHHPPAICQKAYFVCHGVVRQSYQRDGVEVTAYLYLTNSFFTDLRSFLHAKPCNYSFHAVSDCRLQSISYQNLEKLYTSSPSFERWGRKVFETISLEVISSAEGLLFLSPEERFSKLLQESPQVMQLLPGRHIATMLGVTPESFSRLKRRLYNKVKS